MTSHISQPKMDTWRELQRRRAIWWNSIRFGASPGANGTCHVALHMASSYCMKNKLRLPMQQLFCLFCFCFFCFFFSKHLKRKIILVQKKDSSQFTQQKEKEKKGERKKERKKKDSSIKKKKEKENII